MFQLVEQLHKIITKNNPKLAPEKSFFMLLKVTFLFELHKTFQKNWQSCSNEFNWRTQLLHQIY